MKFGHMESIHTESIFESAIVGHLTAITSFLDEKTAQIDTLIEKNQKEIDLLQEYRSAMISEVVTGKIKVI